jgi:pteridine reductase
MASEVPNQPETAGVSGSLHGRVAVVTGGGRRIGAAIGETLHAAGALLLIHCNTSRAEASALAERLNQARPDSASVICENLLDPGAPDRIVAAALDRHGRLDVLVNNASSFYPTPIGEITEKNWQDLIGTNLKAPLFLAQAAAEALGAVSGCIINLVDIHADRPLPDHAVYACAKAGNAMLVKSLARDLAPSVRVNGIAPGAILWPEAGLAQAEKAATLDRVPLRRLGSPGDIAGAALYLARDAGYVTGQIIAVDGGRTVTC